MDIKFPKVHVNLAGEDGNAFAIVGRTQRAMRRAGIPQDVLNEYCEEAFSGDHNHVIQTTLAWVTTDDSDMTGDFDDAEDRDPYGSGEEED